MNFAMNLRIEQLMDILVETKTMDELMERLVEQERVLRVLSERLQNQEQRISQLERPTLMYRRPTETKHESISDTLDYLHNNVEGIKEDLLKVARTV